MNSPRRALTAMVHDERDPAVDSSSSTRMLEPIPGTFQDLQEISSKDAKKDLRGL